jgi:hypothetical protein
MTARLSTDQQAVRAMLRGMMQPDAARLAACYWWPIHELQDARLEMRLCLARLLRRAKVGHDMTMATRAFADDVLQEAIDALGAVHDKHKAELQQIAEDGRRAGLTQRAAVEAVANAARGMRPLPPPWIVAEAVQAPKRPSRQPAAAWRRGSRPSSEHRPHA